MTGSSRAASDAVELIPLDRWDAEHDLHAAERSPHGGVVIPPRFGAFVRSASEFDPVPFGLAAPEALLMDPQQRLLLEFVTEASMGAEATSAAGAGMTTYGAAVSPAFSCGDGDGRKSAGVFVGIASSDYGTLMRQHTAAGGFHATACAPSVASGRVSFTFGFRGPSISVGAPSDSRDH